MRSTCFGEDTTLLLFMCVTQSEYTKGTRLTLSFIKSLSLVSWKDGLMLMNVIKLISSPFFDSKISNTALANPPTLLSILHLY